MVFPLTITLTTPYLSLPEFSKVAGIPYETCRLMVKDGRLPIRNKVRKMEKVLINMIALVKEADVQSRI
ncbi:DNA-binding protein [Acerihabitans sp. TG2]|uniref:DNA-binding protein n=1 Tax=Acerihabitans sp. TG2 TaxID=3096008 RepID=UPI002B226604|nr:DNA-binding protein [Acerihabitans sp. TG2]MEA9393156.1 DNA-binding protein [Acerihabitans sp. TG2]